jgi:transcriptional accessory protein Tex/SPT6
MKKFIFIFFLKTIILFSQNNSGKILYKSYLPTINKLDSTKVHPEIYKDMTDMVKSVDK